MTHPQPSVVSSCSSVLPHSSPKGGMRQVIAITGLGDHRQPDQAIAFTGIRKQGTLRPLASGITRPWSTRHERLSQRYTTSVAEILTATAW